MSVFPASRLRRLRRTDTLRAMVRETALTPGDFILPFFVTHGRGVRDEVSSMPGVFQLSVDELVRDVRELPGLGIPSVLLFGLPAAKDPYGKEAYAPDGIVQQAMPPHLRRSWWETSASASTPTTAIVASSRTGRC
jgi:porphobilinogen synthase